jgi:hypothetical protein
MTSVVVHSARSLTNKKENEAPRKRQNIFKAMAPVRRREEKQMEKEEEEVKGPYAVVLKKRSFQLCVCVCAVRGLVGWRETHNEKNKSVVRHERKKRWKK